MEERINIAELLKDCPKGMELNCTMFNNVTFVRVDYSRKQFPIEIAINGLRSTYLTKEGCFHDITLSPESKCIIFPKGQTTWEGFVPPCQFNDGDIVISTNGLWIGITTGGESGHFIPTYCTIRINGESGVYFDGKEKWMFNRLASEEEKEKLFNALKNNGYRWNAETKTLEKLVELKFKIGDRITNGIVAGKIRSRDNDSYQLDNDVFVFFSALEEWKLDTNKFDITTLKPFESRVLVRDKNTDEWRGHFFSHYDSNSDRPYVCIGVEGINEYKQCIPYKDNEHLLGKTDDCSIFYKTWE